MTVSRRAQHLVRVVFTTLFLLCVGLLSMAALHQWLVQPPILNDLTLFDGLIHGATAPMGALVSLFGRGAVKDFASGWSYELGFYVGGVVLLSLWQTVLQIRVHRALGTVHPMERPVLLGTSIAWGSVVLAGAIGASTWIAPLSDVPPFLGLIPGTIRKWGMTLFALLIPLTTAWACHDLLFDKR